MFPTELSSRRFLTLEIIVGARGIPKISDTFRMESLRSNKLHTTFSRRLTTLFLLDPSCFYLFISVFITMILSVENAYVNMPPFCINTYCIILYLVWSHHHTRQRELVSYMGHLFVPTTHSQLLILALIVINCTLIVDNNSLPFIRRLSNRVTFPTDR